MKILKLRFINLNSLKGEWQIDFRHPAYANEGIFAITGTTGAGKSTILDAICLALYGATPRLGDITQNKNDIMSRQTGECLAEVIFSTKSGTYIACWSQKKAYLKPDGKLQSPKHEIGHFISDDEKSNIIEAKAQRTKLKIEEITGMDFGRFTRAMLLAQGSFAVFLQATSDERSPILEQITGTSIYSDISKKVHEIRQQQKKNLDSLQDKLAGFSPLSEAQEQALQQQQQQLSGKITQQLQQIEQWQQCKNWRENLTHYQHEQTKQQQIYQQLIKQKQDFLVDEQRLQRGLEALKISKNYQKYQELIQQIQQNQTQQQYYQQQSPILQNQLNNQQQRLQTALDRFQNTEQNLTNQQTLFQQVREFDYKINHLHDEIQQLQQQNIAYQHSLQQNQQQTQHITQQKSVLQQQISELNTPADQITKWQMIPTTLVKLENFQQNLIELHHKQDISQKAIQTNQDKQQENQQLLTKVTQDNATLSQQLDVSQQQKQDFQTKFDKLYQTLILDNTNNPLKTLTNYIDTLKSGQQQLRLLQNWLIDWKSIQQNRQDNEKILSNLSDKIDKIQPQIEQNIAQQTSQKQQIKLLNDNILLQHKILSLESEREKLLVGSPCPLCGSTTHPYQQQKPLLEDFDNQSQLHLLEQQLEQQQQVWQQLTTTYHELNANHQAVTQQQATLHQDLQQIFNQFSHEYQIFCQNYKTLNLTISLDDLPEVWQSLDDIIFKNLQTNLSKIDKNLVARLSQYQQVFDTLETYQVEIEKLNQQIYTLEQQLSHITHQQQLYIVQQNQLKTHSQQLSDDKQHISKQIADIYQSIYQVIEPFASILPEQFSDIAQTILSLQSHFSQLEQQQNLLKKQEAKLINLESQLQQLWHENQYLLTQTKNLDTKCHTLQQQLQDNQQKRFELFADKQVTVVEQGLIAEKQQHFDEWQQQNQQFNQLLQSWQSLQENIGFLENLLNKQLIESSQIQTQLSQDFAILGFADEQDYCQSVLSIEMIQQLQGQREQLSYQLNLAENQLVKLNTILQNLQQQNLTTLDSVAIIDNLNQAQTQLSQLQREVGMIEQQLQHNATIKQSQAELFIQFSQQKQTFDEWQQLYELIGSADGKKYRNFVQGLTFNIMISHANAQLKKMSDRYLLVADTEQPLQLNVIDNYQAGIVRTSKNLSGGESFIISLALALGLSSMASHRMQVDSLFLDEGFGTLDEEALDTALDTLSGLQQAGKLIGVISHIEALKERISSKIQVVAQTGGVSKIIGEGIYKLS